jgi:hypothetical protein
MKFSSYPIMESFVLESDPTGETTVTVRQAREGENIERGEMFAKTNRIYDDALIGEVKLQTEYNQRKLRRKEAYLTLASLSGIYTEDDKGKKTEWFISGETDNGPSIKAAMSETSFNNRWNMLPTAVVNEIGKLIHQVNPDWNPERTGE